MVCQHLVRMLEVVSDPGVICIFGAGLLLEYCQAKGWAGGLAAVGAEGVGWDWSKTPFDIVRLG